MTTESFPIRAESLLQHREFVRALARSLVRDEHAAQDVVQETWLEALRHPPRNAAALPGWLARVVRSRAQNVARGESRRVVRERSVAREELDESEEKLHERVAMQHKVVESVLALKEPYKTVVLLHYYEGLSPSQVAARRNMPAGSVRAQLSRAHDLLRERLDAEFGGKREAWSVALFALARKPLVYSLSLKTAVAAAVVLVATIATLLIFTNHGPSSPSGVAMSSPLISKQESGSNPIDAPQSGISSVEPRTGIEPAVGTTPVVAAALPSTVAAVVGTGSWLLVGQVVDSGGRPIEKARVAAFVHPLPERMPELEKQSITGSDGRFELPMESGGDHVVSIAKEGFFPRTENVAFRESKRIDLGVLIVTSGEAISGIVMDASRGIPFAGAHMLVRNLQSGPFAHSTPDGLSWTKDHFELERVESTTGPDGRFSIEGLAQGEFLLDIMPPDFQWVLAGVTGYSFRLKAPANNVTLEYSLPRILFSVVSDGKPVPRARVQVQVPDGAPSAGWTSELGSVGVGVPAGADLDVQVQANGYLPQRLSIKGPQVGQVQIEEVALLAGPAPGKMSCRLVASEDHPVLEASFGFFPDQSTGANPEFTRTAKSKDGTFEVGDIPAGRYRVIVHASSDWNYFYESVYLPADFEIEVAPGDTSRSRVVLEIGGRLMIRIRDSSGESLKAGATFKDSSDRPLSILFVQEDRTAKMMYTSTWYPHVTLAHPEEFVSVQPALAEGQYSAELKLEGYKTRTETFQLAKGQVTHLDVTLEPKGP